MVKKARELAEKHGWFWCRQFENEANPHYHANSTGPEILVDFAGKPLDYWVGGYGTGGESRWLSAFSSLRVTGGAWARE